MSDGKKVECKWILGDGCDGEIAARAFFDSRTNVYVCSKHFRRHLVVMALSELKQDIENCLQMDSDERYEKLCSLVPDAEQYLKDLETSKKY